MTAPDHPAEFVVTGIRNRPDLLPEVTEWLWREWWRKRGRTRAETRAAFAECIADVGPPQTFVLLKGDRPIGTATLARKDLEERPELTPWLAAVFVVPDQRGNGYVHHLLREFEERCRTAAIDTAWLYTNTAERVYRRAGWESCEVIDRPGKLPITLMRRHIPHPPSST